MTRHFLRPGDLIFTPVETAGALGWLGQRVGMKYVHVAMYDQEDGKHYAIEAMWPRIRRVELDERRLLNSHFAYVDADDDVATAARDEAASHVGEWYSVKKVLLAFWQNLVRKGIMAQAEMCSGLVRKAYAEYKVFVTPWPNPLPDHIWDSSIVKPIRPLGATMRVPVPPWNLKMKEFYEKEQDETASPGL